MTSLSPIYFLTPNLNQEKPGRYCVFVKESETTDLSQGDDFRDPIRRRETFLRFYEFHIKYATHPGCVYFLIPYLKRRYGWDDEAAYWFCFLNGLTQNPVTSLLIFRRFPSAASARVGFMRKWFNPNYDRLVFDIDRRYQKSKFLESVAYYQSQINGTTQQKYFNRLAADGFGSTFGAVREFANLGRLSTWSYLEYLSIIGLPIEPDNLLLSDMTGSKSHRNGLCRVLGRDDLDWHKTNTVFRGAYTSKILAWLNDESEILLNEARCRVTNSACNYFTLESALCCYKSWHRPNRRYPNVYADMLYDRIKIAEEKWPDEDLRVFWDARRECLPLWLRVEDVLNDPGVSRVKQNYYLEHGCPVMMHRDWECFANAFNASLDK